ncbi:MAG TPA: c-type cytochrome [Blastocatellia bacterium]|nr:c-type cytochrome [Blastocatellia bacterium]
MSFQINSRLVLLIAWLAAVVGAASLPQPAGAEDAGKESARRVRAILSQRCFQCHGMNGVAKKNLFILDYDRLISSKMVIPRDVNSPLLKAVESGAMPLGGPELPPEEKAALRNWILGGAASWEDGSVTAPPRAFLSEPAILAIIRDDLLRAGERNRSYLRYFSLAHLYNAGVREEELETYRTGLAKLVNSLSWHREITPPAPVDPAKTILRIDLRDYNWTAATWQMILAAYPYGIRTPEGDLVAVLSGAPTPYVRADWFAAKASLPPLYHNILRLPATARELEILLSMDVARNLTEERNVARAGVRNSGVSHNNRVLERHVSAYGAYWKSYDFRSNLDDQNIFKDPIHLRPAGGEIIFHLPNGLQAYFLVNAQGARIDEAPVEIVADRASPDDPVIRNGRSCIGCHFEGMKSFTDDVRPVVLGLAVAPFDRDKALALYPAQETLNQLVEKDREQFLRVLARLGGRMASNAQTEPVNALSRRLEAELSLAQAAAEAGLESQEFREGVLRSARLSSLGFGQLLAPNGGIKRDVWERHFGDLTRELRLGSQTPTSAPLPAVAFNRAPVRTAIAAASPPEILRAARSIFIRSNTIFLKSSKLEDELQKRPEFRELGLVIIRNEKMADIRVELDRPLFTFFFAFTATHPQTSILLAKGKVTAWDGNIAAPKIAKELLSHVKAARTP